MVMRLVFQPVKKLPIESGASLLCSKQHAVCHKREPDYWIQTHPFILILSCHSLLGLTGLLYWVFNTKNIACVCLRSHSYHISRPSHHLFAVAIHGAGYESCSSCLCSFILILLLPPACAQISSSVPYLLHVTSKLGYLNYFHPYGNFGDNSLNYFSWRHAVVAM
jgi:hypothetical protein